MLSMFLTLVLVGVALFVAVRILVAMRHAPHGRWFASGAGAVERWRLTGSREDVLARRLHAASATIDAAVVDALDRPDLGWRLAETSKLIQNQLLVCARLPAPSRPGVHREVEAMVTEFEGVCARLLLDAAQASSTVVRERLREIEESVDVLRQARSDIAELGT